jgi:hypothetical protein
MVTFFAQHSRHAMQGAAKLCKAAQGCAKQKVFFSAFPY